MSGNLRYAGDTEQDDLSINEKENKMSQLEVRIEVLPPMRVISAYGFGSSPEAIAAGKMKAFLMKNNLLAEYGGKIPHYGFNNPGPSSGSPNYGYEIWAGVPSDIEPEGDLRVVQFDGGMYAVTRFENLDRISQVWKELVLWLENSQFQPACHQCLEHLLNPLEPDPAKYVFELYLSIRA
jgi:DNA gyrase inhibitor GyrI